MARESRNIVTTERDDYVCRDRHESQHSTRGIMAFIVFRAAASDAGLARIALAEVHERKPVEAAAIIAFLDDPTCFLFLAVENGQVLGSLNGYALRHPNQTGPQFLLYEIDVRPECRRRGVGSSLVNAFTDAARAAAAFEVWVVSNESTPAALGLYRKCGYRRENDDDVMLSLEL
jgi:ribosomal protein S18 acetylase RimI-like enzyme